MLLIDPACSDLVQHPHARTQLCTVPWPMTVVLLGSGGSTRRAVADAPVMESLPMLCDTSPRVTNLALCSPADNAAVIVFTSGTTGRSKAVLLSHRNLLFQSHAKMVCVPMNASTTNASTTYVTLPPNRRVSATAAKTCMCTPPPSFTWAACPLPWPCCRQEHCRSSPLAFHQTYVFLVYAQQPT